MERVDVVELERAVLRVAERCAPVNQNVLSNPKVHLTIGDARETLLTTREHYDPDCFGAFQPVSRGRGKSLHPGVLSRRGAVLPQ